MVVGPQHFSLFLPDLTVHTSDTPTTLSITTHAPIVLGVVVLVMMWLKAEDEVLITNR